MGLSKGAVRKGWRNLEQLYQPFHMHLILETLHGPIQECSTERLAKFGTALPAFPYAPYFKDTSWVYPRVQYGKAGEIWNSSTSHSICTSFSSHLIILNRGAVRKG